MARKNTTMWKSIVQTAIVASVVYFLIPYIPMPSFGKKA